MAQAIWNGQIIAESEKFEIVDGNTYFPSWTIKTQYFKASEQKSVCSWKGEASYYDVVVEGKVNKDAAWFYPEPSDKAKNIVNHVAFWRGVEVKH